MILINKPKNIFKPKIEETFKDKKYLQVVKQNKKKNCEVNKSSKWKKKWLLWKNIIKFGVGGKIEIFSLIIFALLMSLVVISSTGINRYMSSQDNMIKHKGNVADADISFSPSNMDGTSDVNYEVRSNIGDYNINSKGEIYSQTTTSNYPYTIAKYFGLIDESGNYIHKLLEGKNVDINNQEKKLQQFLYYLKILWNNGKIKNPVTNKDYLDIDNQYIPQAFLNPKIVTILFDYLQNLDPQKYTTLLSTIKTTGVVSDLQQIPVNYRTISVGSSVKLIGTLVNLACNENVKIEMMPYKERTFVNQAKNHSSIQQQSKIIGVPSYFNAINYNRRKWVNDYVSYQSVTGKGPIMYSTSGIFCSQKNYLSSTNFVKHNEIFSSLEKPKNSKGISSNNKDTLQKLGLLSLQKTDQPLFAKPNNNNPSTNTIPDLENQKSYYLSNSEDYNHKHWNALINAVGSYLGNPSSKPLINVIARNFSRSQLPNVLAVLKNGKLSQLPASENGLDSDVKNFISQNIPENEKETNFNYRNVENLFHEINNPVIIKGTMPKFSREVAVNPAFLIKNHKEVWHGNLNKVVEGGQDNFSKNLSTINDKYKITIRGIEMLISGEATTPEYMYSQFSPLNLSPDNKNQAIVFTYNMYFTDSLGASIFQTTSNSTSQSTNGLFVKVVKGTRQNKKNFLQKIKGLNSFVFKKLISGSSNQSLIGTKVNLYNDPGYIYYSRTNFLGRLLKGIGIITWICTGIILCDCILIILLIIRSAMHRDRKQIGILRALGYKNSDVNLPYIFYPVMCGVIGVTLSLLLFSIFTYVSMHFLLGYFNVALQNSSFVGIVNDVVSTNYAWTFIGILFPIFLITTIALILAAYLMRKPVINLILE